MNLDALRDTVKEACRLDPGRVTVVGVSGGPDSLCLLDALNRLGYPLWVAHFDHGLRPESGQDALRVEEMARALALPFVSGHEQVRRLAGEWRVSIEEAARKARYQFLFAQARAANAQAVAVAHTADDQVETVLMHLLRGSGLNGLKGMTWRSILPAWDPAIPIVRPLLGTWRAETETWCQQFGLEPLYDASNQDLAFFRNRLRHELIPFLQTYNPGVKDGIWRMAQALAGDAEVLSEVTAQAWSRCQAEFGAESGSFNLEQFQDLSPGLRRSVLRKAVALLRPGLRDIDFRGVERALAWLGRPVEGKVIDLKDGLCLWIEWGRVHVGEAARPPAPLDCPQVEPGAQFWLQPGDEIRLLNGWVLRASLRAPEDEAVNSSYYLVGEGLGRLELGADLDADALQWPLLVRTAQKGEQFAPLGMGGRHARLSDFFINRKVPRRVRAGWPLVTSGGKVAWLAGLRMGEIGKMSPQTRRCVHIELRKVQN